MDNSALSTLNKKRKLIFSISSVSLSLCLSIFLPVAALITAIAFLEDQMAFYAMETGKTLDFYAFAEERENLWVIAFILAFIILLSLYFSISRVGEKLENGKVHLNWFDKIFVDIQILFSMIVTLLIVPTSFLFEAWIYTSDYYKDFIISAFSSYESVENGTDLFIPKSYQLSPYSTLFAPSWVLAVISFVIVLLIITVNLATVYSIVKKLKNRTLIKNTLIGAFIHYLMDNSFTSKALLAKVLVMLIACTIISSISYGFVIVIIWIFIFIPPLVKKLQLLREGIKEVKEGNIDHKISLPGKGVLSEMALDINSISNAQQIAVARELKVQRLKSELISNVSHDLRTPLTSIVSYLDLLKREGLESPNAEEYVSIISDKTMRLQKLTDDLFEAAKASSGDVRVNIEKLNLISIINQSLGELSSNLKANSIEPILSINTKNAYVLGDGKLLWRVIENLLVNISKYAQHSSRAYIDIFESGSGNFVELEMKNVSRAALNMSATELIERFKRGDQARNTEGSGLGLAIARDLVTLMNGKFNIAIDGDLFKVSIVLPKA